MERRFAHRRHFIAEAQVIDLGTGTKLSGRTSDLAIHGCYVDCMNTLPVGTPVRIRLIKGESVVEAEGNVVYEMAGLGMGITFRNVSPEGLSELEEWVSQLPVGSVSAEAWAALDHAVQPAVLQELVGPFGELVRILVKKGVLTESEAAAVFKVPPDES